MDLVEKVKETIKRYRMFDFGDKVVVGVSGGPDSVCLLYLLNSLKDELNLYLHIGHLDHMLRKSSYRDLLFVREIAKELEIPVTTEKINIPKLAKKGSIDPVLARKGGVEEIARKVRFDFLFKVAREIRTKKIALGHNRDDQAETVLLRILRGSGLYGLRGILPFRRISGFLVVRPLIEIRRKEIENYLRRRRIKTIIDRSNIEPIYFRNKIRNRLLPLLEKEYNPNIREIFFNMAETIGCDYEFLELESRKALKKSKIPSQGGFAFSASGGFGEKNQKSPAKTGSSSPPPADSAKKINLNLEKFIKYHPAIQRMVLRLAISELKGDTRRLTFKHFQELEDLIRYRPEDSIVDLPGKVSVQKKENCLSIYFR